ncbi:inositol 2-dehydrogenase [Colwellia sp. E150_009]
MINIALLGAGRIGQMHAKIITDTANCKLSYVFDVYKPSAEKVAAQFNASVAEDVDVILNDEKVNAVLIATTTDTHVDLIIKAAKAGKAILCEKPIDLSTERVQQCWQEIQSCNVPIQIGFNRRFDPTHASLQQQLAEGAIGDLQQLIITSRDPDIAPTEYLRHSGGIFRDMIIHDFDMLRFITGEEATEIHAIGNTLIDPNLAEFNDVDSVMITIKTQSGRLCHINGSRRCVYGYDQRIEAFGGEGMLQSTNPLPHNVVKSTAANTASESVLNPFFIERYQSAYQAQFVSFINALTNGTKPSPSFEDGLVAQKMADAAQSSLETGQTVIL